MELLPMTDYVIDLENREYRGRGRWDEERYFDAIAYARFLKQPLKIEMLVSENETNVIFQNVVKRPINEHGSYAVDIDGKQVAYYKALPKYWVITYRTIEELTGLGLTLKGTLKL